MAKTSRLERLFRYAKASQAEALENFVTEALAAAVQEDSAPLLKALAEVGVVRDEVTEVETQVGAPGVGIFDMRLSFETGTAVVVEVKVWSPPDFEQLAKYEAWCVQHAGQVVLLAPSTAGSAPWLSWQRLFVCAKGAEHPYWRDLCDYLEELGLANGDDHPFSAADAAVLAGGPALLKRAVAAIAPVLPALQAAWPKATWPVGADLERQLRRRWTEGEGLTCEQRVDGELGLALGLRGGDDGISCAIWIWRKPFRERVALLALAEALPKDVWTVSPAPGDWVPIEATTAAAGMAPAAVAEWFRARVAELQGATLLELLNQRGAVGSVL